MTSCIDVPGLTDEEVAAFHRDGYLAPLTACSEPDMARYRDHFSELLGDTSRHRPDHNRHLDNANLTYANLTYANLTGVAGWGTVKGKDAIVGLRWAIGVPNR